MIRSSESAPEQSRHSPPRLDLREQNLPWAHLSIFVLATTIKAVGGACHQGVACCKAVNGGSGLAIRKAAMAVQLASKQPGGGGAGMPVSAIGPARRARNGGARQVGAIANAGSSKRRYGLVVLPHQLQLALRRGARASAQQKIVGILSGGLAIGPVVTRGSLSSPVRRVNISVRALAVRRYDACSTGKPTGVVAIGIPDGSAGRRRVPRPIPPEVVSPYCEVVCGQCILPRLGEAGRSGRVRLTPAPRFLSRHPCAERNLS